MKILVVSPDFPFPANHGARVDIYRRLLDLRALGHSVTLLATVKELPSDGDLQSILHVVDDVVVLRRSKSLTYLLNWKPWQVTTRSLCSVASLPVVPDLILLESEYAGEVLKNSTITCEIPIITRVHNNETKYYLELGKSATNPLIKAFYWVEALKFLFYSRSIFRESKALAFISSKEFDAYKSRNNASNSAIPYFLPVSIEMRKVIAPIERSGANCIFIGSLFVKNNVAGLRWYLKNIHPKLLELKDYKLTIAGNTRGIPQKLLAHWFGEYERVELVASPGDLDSIYQRAAVFINPARHGGGVKVKSIEAIMMGMPLVSTSIGVEGTGFCDKKHALIADSPSEFLNCVKSLLLDPNKGMGLARNAQEFLFKQYNARERLAELLLESKAARA